MGSLIPATVIVLVISGTFYSGYRTEAFLALAAYTLLMAVEADIDRDRR